MKLFFDLDGTLIDSKIRLYNLFQDLVSESKFTFDEYWQLKKEKINHEKILIDFFNFNEEEIKLFQEKWMSLIESDKYLKFDKPFDITTDYLLDLKNKGFLLYVVTARQYKNKAISQINSFGWQDFFSEILVTEQKNKKEELISPFIERTSKNFIIGDTGSDVNVGKVLKIKTVAVLSGFLSERVLITYNPDFIFNNIAEFKPNKIK